MPFITFEGIDGSGKTTQAELLVERLAASGRRVTLFREPGGPPLSERIRSILLDPALQIGGLAELFLFSSARAQLVEERIRPALKAGEVVVCDRFYDSTTAYQGAGRGVADPEWIAELNRRVTGGLVPERTYLVEIDYETAARRRTDGPEAEPADRMERSDAEFYDRVAAAYARLAEREADRFVRLDGKKSVEALRGEIWSDVQRLLAQNEGTASSG